MTTKTPSEAQIAGREAARSKQQAIANEIGEVLLKVGLNRSYYVTAYQVRAAHSDLWESVVTPLFHEVENGTLDLMVQTLKATILEAHHEGRISWGDHPSSSPSASEGGDDPDEEVVEVTTRKTYHRKEGKPSSPASKLKIAFWFIDKVGGPDEAIKIVKAAAAAHKELSAHVNREEMSEVSESDAGSGGAV